MIQLAHFLVHFGNTHGQKLENKLTVSVTLPLRDSTLAHIPTKPGLMKEEL